MKLNFSTNTGFNAKIYNMQGVRYKNFDKYSNSKHDETENRGSHNTEIRIKGLISTQNNGVYNNAVKCTVYNPLFGEHEFAVNLQKHSNSLKNYFDETHYADILTKNKNCDKLENYALAEEILDTMQIGHAVNKQANLSPLSILQTMLKNCPKKEHGFTKARIKEFSQIAQNLQNGVLHKGIDSLNNK